jgi:hypothetical protein
MLSSNNHETNHSLAQKIIGEARLDAGTWSLAFMKEVTPKVEMMKKDQADSLAEDLLQMIFKSESNPHFKFKLCQMCSVIHSKDLCSFEVSFKKFQDEIKKFIEVEKNSFFSAAINGLLMNLLKTPFHQPKMCA